MLSLLFTYCSSFQTPCGNERTLEDYSHDHGCVLFGIMGNVSFSLLEARSTLLAARLTPTRLGGRQFVSIYKKHARGH